MLNLKKKSGNISLKDFLLKDKAIKLLAAVLVILVCFLLSPFKLVITKDVSLSGTVWIETPFKPSKGDFVIFTVEKDNRYYPPGTRLLKIDVCSCGDLLETKGLEYFCNGKFLGKAVTRDRKGNPVKHFEFSGKIPEGFFFAMGTHPRSYDSRYLGFISFNTAHKVWRLF